MSRVERRKGLRLARGWGLLLMALAVVVEASGKVYLHFVRPGECPWGIARTYGIPVEELLEANGLDEGSVLLPGQRLRIPLEEAPGLPRWAKVKRGPARLRSGPGERFKVLDLLPVEERVRLLGKRGSWARVRTSEGKEGWVAGWLLGFGQPPEKPSETDEVGRKLVALAMRYLGVRYRRGGATSRGMDCSGLVYRVFALLGKGIPHRASSLYRLGKPVKKSELEPGDLVFFRSWRGGRGVGHVGIYIGGGKFIHASSGEGEVVISDLRKGSYARRYVGARRLR